MNFDRKSVYYETIEKFKNKIIKKKSEKYDKDFYENFNFSNIKSFQKKISKY